MTTLTLATASNDISTALEAALEAATQENDLRSSAFRQTYHEISDRHVVENDVLEQLRANMAQLEDLHGRLRYATSEIVYLTKKN